ncbi:MAG: choice-of-anchor D domain-containing protein, partial [Candidatus Latescibacterota bacterium]
MNTLLHTWATTPLSLLFLATITFAQSVQVTPRALLIPPTKPNSAIEAELLVKNVQDDPIEVLTGVINGPFTVSPDTLRIPPAAQRPLTVVFKASKVQSYEGTLSLQVKDFFKGDKTTVSVRASVVRPQLALHPTNSLAFDSVDTRQTVQAFFTLKNTGEVDAPIDSIYWRQQPTPFQLIEDMPSTLRPGQQVKRSITLRSEQGGSFSNQLRIVSLDHPPLELDVSARVNAPLAAVSPLPDVGVQYQTVDIGGSAVRTVTVLNKGLADLRINTAEVTGSGFLTPDVPTPTTLPPGERVEIRIPFQPKLVGQQRGQLRLETDDPLAPDISIPLRGEGQISPPRIEVLNGTNVHFDSVPLGKTQRDHVLLWNRGGTPYTTRIEMRDGDGIEFSLGSNSLLLQPGESGKVAIDFSPKEIGLRESTIGIVTEQGERTLR